MLAAAAPGGLVGLVFTAATDRYSRRVIATGGALGFTVSLGLVAASPSFASLLVASFVMAIASTAMVDAIEVALVDLVPGTSLRRWLAAQNLGGAAGALAGPVLLALVFWAGGSWRVAFWLVAVVMAAYTVVVATSSFPPPTAADDGDARVPWRDVLASVSRDRRVWVLGALSVLTGPFDEDFLAFLVAALQRTRGATPAVAVIVASASVVGGFVTLVLAARRVEPWPDRTLYFRGACALVAGAVLVALGLHLVVSAAGAFLVGAGLELCWLALQHRTLTARPGQAGVTKAAVSAIEFSGVVVTLGLGVVADRLGISAVLALYAVIAVVTAAIARVALRE